MLLSRMMTVDSSESGEVAATALSANTLSKLPKLEDFLTKRDFIGALTLLEFLKSLPPDHRQQSGSGDSPLTATTASKLIPYCLFHLGDYQKALKEYKSQIDRSGDDESIKVSWLNVACCYFYLGMYKEAEAAAEKGKECDLQTRLLFHLAHKLNNDDRLLELHEKLEDILENQLSLASVHYLRGDFQSSIDIYKRVLVNNSLLLDDKLTDAPYLGDLSDYMLDLINMRCRRELPLIQILLSNKEYLALNVYVALCYHRLEYYDVSQEVLAVYLQAYPDSAIALNLRACNTFRLYTGIAAEKELKPLLNLMQHEDQTKQGPFSSAYDLIRHNLVVFRGGEGALQVLPKLVGIIPEARLNLIIYYLHQEDIRNAYELTRNVTPKTVPEHILHAIVNVLLAQQNHNSSRECMSLAQTYYHRIGSSDAEHDSVFGRLCMASAHFLSSNFDHCALYLNSVRTHYYNDDTFNYNYGQALAMLNQFQDAEAVLLMVQNEKLRNDFTYMQCLARCLIMNKKPRIAWEIYERMDTSPESFQLLQLIANECYRMGQFYYAAKAFDILEKFDPSQENWEGKRGACVGVFQLIIAGHEPKESLPDIISLLRHSSKQNVEKILTVMKKWAKDNQFNL